MPYFVVHVHVSLQLVCRGCWYPALSFLLRRPNVTSPVSKTHFFVCSLQADHTIASLFHLLLIWKSNFPIKLSDKGSKLFKSSAAVFVNPNFELRFHIAFLLFAYFVKRKCDILSNLYSQYEPNQVFSLITLYWSLTVPIRWRSAFRYTEIASPNNFSRMYVYVAPLNTDYTYMYCNELLLGI